MKRRHVNFGGAAILTLTFIPLALAQIGSSPRSVNWEGVIPAIRELLNTESTRYPEFGRIEDSSSIRISKTADITGDGVPEALVSLGTGGAYTEAMTVMSMEDRKPVLAMFRDRSGKVSPGVFLQGASVMHSESVELLPMQHAVHAIHFNYGSDGKLHRCGGEAYIWNAHSKTFDYNPRLTKALTKATCRQVPRSVEQQ